MRPSGIEAPPRSTLWFTRSEARPRFQMAGPSSSKSGKVQLWLASVQAHCTLFSDAT